jgi:hypothetical protein
MDCPERDGMIIKFSYQSLNPVAEISAKLFGIRSAVNHPPDRMGQNVKGFLRSELRSIKEENILVTIFEKSLQETLKGTKIVILRFCHFFRNEN